MKQVAILVPGIMGSELYLHDQLIWPGPARSLVFKYKLMHELLRPDLRVGDIIRTFSFSEQYQSLVDSLAKCGFTSDQKTFYACPYDWRKRNEDAATVLAQKIETITDQHHGDLEITILAHSMGGLITRYYLESDLFTQSRGFGAVRRFIALATPHRGSPLALTAAMGMERRLFLNAEQVKDLANKDAFPAVYQLLPPTDEHFAWDDQESDSRFKPFPVYSNPVALGLNPNNLQAAMDFRSKLFPLPRPPQNLRYFFFTGTRMKTLANVHITHGASNQLSALRVELEDAGDGTVPTWSGGLPGVQGQFVGGEHGTIYKNDGLLRTLGTLLGCPGVLAWKIPQVQVAVRDKVLAPRDAAHVVLTFPVALRRVAGNLLLQQIVPDAAGGGGTPGALLESYPVRYEGLGAEKLALTFSAPSEPGMYRVGYSEDKEMASESSDDFFVQSTMDIDGI